MVVLGSPCSQMDHGTLVWVVWRRCGVSIAGSLMKLFYLLKAILTT